jgi:hypothetical protein
MTVKDPKVSCISCKMWVASEISYLPTVGRCHLALPSWMNAKGPKDRLIRASEGCDLGEEVLRDDE